MSKLLFLLFKLNTLHKETLHWHHNIQGKPDKMLILNLIRFKVETKLITFVKNYIRKYMNMIIKWILNDFKKNWKRLSEKPWSDDNGVLNLHHGYYITIFNDVKGVVSWQPSIKWYKSANQKIGIRTVYESWIIKVVIKFLSANFLLGSAIMPDHWLLHRSIITFPRFLDRRLLFCRNIACILYIFFINLFCHF